MRLKENFKKQCMKKFGISTGEGRGGEGRSINLFHG